MSLSPQSPNSHCNSITCLQTERILRVRAGFLARLHIPSTQHDVRHTQHMDQCLLDDRAQANLRQGTGIGQATLSHGLPRGDYHEEKKACLIVRMNPKTRVYTILNMKYFIYTNCHKSASNLQSEFMKHKHFAPSSSYYCLNTALFPGDLRFQR